MRGDDDQLSGQRERRYPIALRIKLRYTRVEQFISKFATNLSRNGMFLSSRNPKPVGTRIYFELRLADDSRLIEGGGEVRWIREYDKDQPDLPFGMGIQFLELDDRSRAVLDQAIEMRRARGDLDLDSIPGQGRSSSRRAARVLPAEAAGDWMGDDAPVRTLESARDAARAPALEAQRTPATEAQQTPATEAHLTPATEAHLTPAIEAHLTPATEAHLTPATEAHLTPAIEAHLTPAIEAHLTPATEARSVHEVETDLLAAIEDAPAARPRRSARVSALLADAASDVVDGRGRRVADAVRRARELARGLAAESDEDLADLLDQEAVPRATVDQASRELATRELGRPVAGARYRAPRVEAEPAPSSAERRPLKPVRTETIDAALLALEQEESRGDGPVGELVAAGRAADRALLDDLGALRHASLPGRAGTEIPIDVDDDDIIERADVEGGREP